MTNFERWKADLTINDAVKIESRGYAICPPRHMTTRCLFTDDCAECWKKWFEAEEEAEA